MATRVIGGFDEEETCAATRTHSMRLCTSRAMLAAAGGEDRRNLPGTCSIFIDSSLPAANEDQAARIGFLRKGHRRGEKVLGSKVKRMVGISVPVPPVDDGAIVAALHIVWALRGRAATHVNGRVSNPGFSPPFLLSF